MDDTILQSKSSTASSDTVVVVNATRQNNFPLMTLDFVRVDKSKVLDSSSKMHGLTEGLESWLKTVDIVLCMQKVLWIWPINDSRM